MKLNRNVLGEHISVVAKAAVDLVAKGEPEVTFEFNGINLTVKPGMSAEDVCADFDRQLDAEHEAYISSPEYKAQQLEREKLERERTAKREAALAQAPQSMTLRDPEGWTKTKAANNDGYGAAILTYAERWARLMEGAISKGASIAGCADELSHLADVEGITGFMYGAAVSILAQVWIHGEELRRWHNKHMQIGDEGDRANEDGGVLNPAMLVIKG